MLDTEDLNGDQGLDLTGANENVFRYVVDLAAGTFFVRDGVTTTDAQGRSATWKLYRIPIRQPTAVINTPTLRLMQHLRITLATPTDAGVPDSVARFALARMRFVGSPWTRRSETPILGPDRRHRRAARSGRHLGGLHRECSTWVTSHRRE